MKLIKGKYKSIEEAKPYFDLLKKLYSEVHGFDYYFGDLSKALEQCLQQPEQDLIYLSIQEDDRLTAHAALILDRRLPEGECFFGFFECEEQGMLFDNLWEGLMSEAKAQNISKLRGPVNGSIWHAYRIIKSSHADYPIFNSEPITQSWYYEALTSRKPSEELEYYSASRAQYDFITQHTAASYKSAIKDGLRIILAQQINQVLLAQIYELARGTFSRSWSYTELSMQEFAQLYSSDKIEKHIGKLYLLMKEEKLIGFCSSVKEENKLILKTIAVRPENHAKGYGNALVHKVHYEAREEGVAEIIYALIRSGNKVSNFPKEHATIFREYAGFVFFVQ